MTSSKKHILEELAQCLSQKATADQVVTQTLALLQKVDQRRREHPHDRQRWDARAKDLEESLLENKGRVTVLDQRILELTQEPEPSTSPQEAVADSSKDMMVPELPDPETLESAAKAAHEGPEIHPNVLAAQRMLDLPLFKLPEAPLEDYILAKLFMESSESKSLNSEKRSELSRRIMIYDRSVDQRRQVEHPTESPQERREQMLLRAALDKCLKNQVGTLTLDEINIIIGCYDILLQQADEQSSNDRLVGIVNEAIDKICATWKNMEYLKKSVKKVREKG